MGGFAIVVGVALVIVGMTSGNIALAIVCGLTGGWLIGMGLNGD